MAQKLLVVLVICCAIASAVATPHSPIKPSYEAARSNAYHIFNAIHSAGRQWGSSFYHNGFSFFPAVVPRGTLTYHGGWAADPPKSQEWLAFEIEHAENFAPSHRRGPWRPNATDDDDPVIRGYLHTYRANRDLSLLYIDGMSAGKTQMGTLDSQDLILRENKTRDGGFKEEWQRAEDLCQIVTSWGYDGIIRDEIGFEVIYCDFSNGLDFLSATRTFFPEDKLGSERGLRYFQWARAAAERYDSLGGDRVRLDLSSMVSGFFFPINISSTFPGRPDLIRLAAASLDELKDIKTHLRDVAKQPRRFTVNWQALVDMIVTRFADRFATMESQDTSATRFIDELEASILLYVNAPSTPEDETLMTSAGHERQNETEKAIDRCSDHFLLPALASRDIWSLEDELIHTAVSAVTSDICNNLFTMRTIFLELTDHAIAPYRIDKDKDGLDLAFNMSRPLMQSMTKELGWTVSKAVRRCPVREIPFIAMWPLGTEADHWNPGCRSVDELADMPWGYWMEGDRPLELDTPIGNDEL